MKNKKMSTTISIAIFLVITVSICLLYIIASKSMTSIMKKAEIKSLHETLNAETSIIEEYIHHQEDLLISYSNESEVIEFLKDPDNEEKRKKAQGHTEKYYERLVNWEGLYIGEWNTHVIAHSNPDIVGMVTREGEPLKELQDAMTTRNGLYNAGIIVSPASQKLILSLYCPVYDYDRETILGYVGGGPYAQELKSLLYAADKGSATYYMINVKSNMYIFAEDESLMATEIEDKMLRSIISAINENESQISGEIEYQDDINGKSIATYQYVPEYGWAVIYCNSEENIYADINKVMFVLGVICIASVVIIVFLSWLVIRISTKPLKHVEKAIVQLKDMDLEKDPMLDKYINGKSEVGQIATAIDSLYDSIEEMFDAEKEKQVAIAKSESQAQFLASMSHEIRTPINSIIGMNEMILQENDNPQIHEYASNVNSSSQMLLGLVNDILDFSKMEAGKLQVFESEYDVAYMLKTAIFCIESYAKQKDIELKSDIDSSLPKVLIGDEIRIKQIINNLLSNAIKYTDKGSVTFSVKGSQDENGFTLIMSVTDTGIGIKEEDIGKLFDGFVRLDMKKNRYKQGTGLGLSITKQLVDLMNGNIEVSSEYEKGSCFTVRLPQQVVDDTCIGKIADLNDKKTDEAMKAKKKMYASDSRVLAVDDNDMNLKVIGAFFKDSGVELDLATGGNEALEKTKIKKYDLILMDHMMPEPDGIETLHLIKEDEMNLNRETNVIVLTANAIAGVKEEYIREGFSEYLSKPIVRDKFEEMLDRYLRKK